MAGPWEQYQSTAPAVADAPTDGPWTKYQSAPATPPAGFKSTYGEFSNTLKDALLAGGNATGFQSGLGQGFLDVVNTAVKGGAYLRDLVGSKGGNYDAVKADIDASNADYEKNAPSGAAAGRLTSNIVATLPVGGLLGKAAGALGASPAVATALSSSGMTTGKVLPEAAKWLGAKGADMALRTGTSGAVGFAAGGLLNPDDAAASGKIGAMLPGGLKVVGSVANAIGGALKTKVLNPNLQRTVQDSLDAGYVIPPNMVSPNLKNQIIESISGKQATQQIASTKNTVVTERLVRQSLGIADDVPLSKATLENLRKTAGKAYGDVSQLSPQAAADLEALKVARNESSGWFKAYNRSASPNDLAQAKNFRAEADALESALEAHAASASRPELIPALRDARRDIAKTYTVGRALNDASGTVDARVFGRMSEKGMPLSDGLDVAGRFASAFPTVAKSPQQIGSPAAHNLKAFGAAMMGGGGYAAMGPIGAAAAILPFIAPPVARAQMFSRGTQRGLLSGGAESSLLDNSAMMRGLLPLTYRAAPAISAQ